MSGRSILLAVAASIISSICFAKEPSMSDVKTYCFGRYLVDIPSEAEVNGQAYKYKYDRIDTSLEAQSDFEKRMSSREVDLRAGKQKDRYSLIEVLRPTADIRVFELSKQLLTGPAGGLEAYRWDEGRTFSMQGTAYAINRLADVAATLQKTVLPNLRTRNPNSIPSQSGFCLKDGFIADDGTTPQYEDAGISFKFPQWPGILVSVNSSTVTKLGEPKLLERIDQAPVPDAYKNAMRLIRDLRKGKRVVSGRDGEEILSTIPTEGGYRIHQFQWEAQGSKINDPLDPTLTVEFESGMTRIDGQPARPKISDEDAIRLFDAVVNSIRLRPTNGGGKVSGIEPTPTLPLGTLAQTGSICPQSGWWTCPEANGQEIVGGARQRFEAGSVMPVVRVVSRAALLDRMLGKQTEHSVDTTWKLVGLDEAPAKDAGGSSEPNVT